MAIGVGYFCKKHTRAYSEECYECLREERDQLQSALRAWVNTTSHPDCAACGAVEVELSKQ